MKVRSRKIEQFKLAFEPKTIEIDLETIQEARALYFIFNHNFIMNSKNITGNINYSQIRNAIGIDVYNENMFCEFSADLKKRFIE